MSANYLRVTLAEAIEICGAHKAVAATCGVNLRTVYRWATGEKPIPRDREAQIRAALDAAGGTTPQALREIADVAEGLLSAEANGKIDAAELVMIEREGLQAIVEIMRAIRLARQRKEDGQR